MDGVGQMWAVKIIAIHSFEVIKGTSDMESLYTHLADHTLAGTGVALGHLDLTVRCSCQLVSAHQPGRRGCKSLLCSQQNPAVGQSPAGDRQLIRAVWRASSSSCWALPFVLSRWLEIFTFPRAGLNQLCTIILMTLWMDKKSKFDYFSAMRCCL